MKKITVLGIFLGICFTVLPPSVFATIGDKPDCETPSGGTTPECTNNILSFKAISDSSYKDKDIWVGEHQLFVEIESLTGEVKFSFYNTGPYSSTITAIYFGDNIPVFDYTTAEIDNGGQAGVAFSSPATPASMPGGLDFPAVMFSADNDSPVINGIDPGEYLDIIIEFEGGLEYDTLFDALADGSMSLGLHVQRLGSSASGSIKMTSIACLLPGGGDLPVPEPTTILLLGTGLVGLAGTARKRKKMRT